MINLKKTMTHTLHKKLRNIWIYCKYNDKWDGLIKNIYIFIDEMDLNFLFNLSSYIKDCVIQKIKLDKYYTDGYILFYLYFLIIVFCLVLCPFMYWSVLQYSWFVSRLSTMFTVFIFVFPNLLSVLSVSNMSIMLSKYCHVHVVQQVSS